ncbi:unnamed protein product [Caenorhabditis bovis]|uniref:Uncharacterized protein n=1 Tax=Caenorhabditis bovis TaxID=2654633 RepID=A0A8S1F8M0_9PELO|nr:unnamed protein product [Caenorhabditis bovis]
MSLVIANGSGFPIWAQVDANRDHAIESSTSVTAWMEFNGKISTQKVKCENIEFELFFDDAQPCVYDSVNTAASQGFTKITEFTSLQFKPASSNGTAYVSLFYQPRENGPLLLIAAAYPAELDKNIIIDGDCTVRFLHITDDNVKKKIYLEMYGFQKISDSAQIERFGVSPSMYCAVFLEIEDTLKLITSAQKVNIQRIDLYSDDTID